MTWDTVYQRSLDDLLKSERARREALESDRAGLVELLTRLAQRHAGQRLEDLRRENPATPKHWSAQEWEAFFSRPEQPNQVLAWGQPAVDNGCNVPSDAQALQQLQQEMRNLRTQVEHSQPVANDQRPFDFAQDRLATKADSPVPSRLSSVSLTAFAPPVVPYKYKGLLGQHGLTDLRWRRGSMLLFLMASRGMNAHLELDALIAQREGLSYRSNSTKKPLENLAAAGLVIAETLRMETDDFRTALKLTRLTDTGRELCQALDWPVIESDWERLIRLHQGLAQPRHTLAVLYFALLARVRGWATEIVPDVDGSAAPDMRVAKDELNLYVEVELGSRGDQKQTAKWKHLADLQGRVAICAPNVTVRERQVKDCQLAKIGGVATDLATLVARKYHEAENEPLWFKEWK